MFSRYYFLYFVFILSFTVSCGSGIGELHSKSPPEDQPNTALSSPDSLSPGKVYAITNDFRDQRGNAVYIHLSSVNTKEIYIIPPTQYSEVELDYIKIDMKVEGECVEVPDTAFPVLVSVCKSSESSNCPLTRSLDVLLKNPAHYNINGIGGLLTPQVYPVSPCSGDLVKLIGTIGEYDKL